VGEENTTYPSHRELNAVRELLKPDIEISWLRTDGVDGHELAPSMGFGWRRVRRTRARMARSMS